jgi:hypothetical protein
MRPKVPPGAFAQRQRHRRGETVDAERNSDPVRVIAKFEFLYSGFNCPISSEADEASNLE